MKKTILTIILTALTLGMFAQEFKVPVDYKFEKDEDYAMYEKDIVNCVNWLLMTPLNEKEAKRKEVEKFLLKWMMGSPDVTIEIRQDIITFMGSSPELLIIFMGGWTKYVIESKNNDNLEGNIAGLNAAINFYVKNKEHMKKDKNVEKFIKMKEKNTLRDFVQKKLK